MDILYLRFMTVFNNKIIELRILPKMVYNVINKHEQHINLKIQYVNVLPQNNPIYRQIN